MLPFAGVNMSHLVVRTWIGLGFALGGFVSAGCDSRPLDGATPGAAGTSGPMQTGEGGQAGTTGPSGSGGAPVTRTGIGTWLDRSATGSVGTTDAWPSARSNHALAYDQGRDRVVLFAGTNETRLQDLWELDPHTGAWTNRTPNPPPASWPRPHYGHAMAYDSARGKCVVFGGGTTSGVLDETWEWDGAAGTWERRAVGGARPPALSAHAMTYDADRGVVVLFGGFDNRVAGPGAQVWEWDGVAGTWTNRTPASLPAAWPSARSAASLVYDNNRQRSVLFGGFNNVPGGFFSEVWDWDGRTGTWLGRPPALAGAAWPAARSNHAAVYDPRRGTILIFGGAHDGITLGDSWEWDGVGGGFADQTPPTAVAPVPGARASHALVYVNSRSSALLFGGCCSINDMWEWIWVQ